MATFEETKQIKVLSSLKNAIFLSTKTGAIFIALIKQRGFDPGQNRQPSGLL